MILIFKAYYERLRQEYKRPNAIINVNICNNIVVNKLI